MPGATFVASVHAIHAPWLHRSSTATGPESNIEFLEEQIAREIAKRKELEETWVGGRSGSRRSTRSGASADG